MDRPDMGRLLQTTTIITVPVTRDTETCPQRPLDLLIQCKAVVRILLHCLKILPTEDIRPAVTTPPHLYRMAPPLLTGLTHKVCTPAHHTIRMAKQVLTVPTPVSMTNPVSLQRQLATAALILPQQ